MFIIYASYITKYQLKIFNANVSNVKVKDTLVLSKEISAAYATYRRVGS